MIICFNCRKQTKAGLDKLLQSGQYTDYSDIISVAVANLAVLHSEMAGKGPVVIGEPRVSTGPSAISPPRQGKRSDKSRRQKREAARVSTRKTIHMPPIFQLTGSEKPPSEFAPAPPDEWGSHREVPLDRWVFGQHNKILPVKASGRALVHLLADCPNGVPLEQAWERISIEAAALGEYLAQHDQKHSIRRDDALATAFPRNGKDLEKSRVRYNSQFIASVSSQGQLSGLLCDYKFINRSAGESPALHLTEPGWNFAAMRNPVLDGPQETPAQRFGMEEIDFLLEHIARVVPIEDFAFRSIISAIQEGADTPDALDAALNPLVSKDTSRSLSKSFLSSQRSGAISRMADLGLIARVRKGIRVSYAVTKDGIRYGQNAYIH